MKAHLPLNVSSALDDAGLSVYAFRLAGRIARRWSAKSGCYEKVNDMAKACGIDRKTAWKAIGELLERGVIVKESRLGTTTRYDFAPIADWSDLSHETGQGCTTGRAVPRDGTAHETGQVRVPPHGTPPVPPDGTQRDPMKGSNEGIPNQKRASDPVPYDEIVDDLNARCETAYRPTSKATRRLIAARWADGFRLGDFREVHRKQSAAWLPDGRMARYLRPETLYGSKFESYLNAHVQPSNPSGLRAIDRADAARNDPRGTFQRSAAAALAALGA